MLMLSHIHKTPFCWDDHLQQISSLLNYISKSSYRSYFGATTIDNTTSIMSTLSKKCQFISDVDALQF